METEKNFWIRGNRQRGEEVIAALKQLGGINKYNLQGIKENKIYYINHCGYITSTFHDTEEAYLIKKYYKEVKLQGLFSEGDILINKTKKEFCVFKEYDDYSYDYFAITLYVEENKYDIHKDTDDAIYAFITKYFRKATEEEIEEFHEILHKFHIDWNVQNKKLEHWVWKPKFSELYFFVDSLGCAVSLAFNTEAFNDKRRVEIGNCFKTLSEAEKMAAKFRELLKNS